MADQASLDIRRLVPAWPWLAFGLASVVAGGLVAAVVAHDPTEKPVWTSAYLVLVSGVGLLGLALGRTLLAPHPPTYAVLGREFAIFTLGNIGVVVGTLVDAVWVTDIGGALLVVSLGLMMWGVRPTLGPTPDPAHSRATGWQQRLGWAYRVLVVVLLVSIPIGLVLARQ